MDVINPLHHAHEQSDLQLKTDTVPSGVELRQLIESLFRQHRLILSITGLIVAAAILFLVLVQERYTASAILVIDESQSQLLGVEAALSTGATLINRVDTEVEILNSPSVFLRTIEE